MEQLELPSTQGVTIKNNNGMSELMQSILRAKANFDAIRKTAINSYIGNKYATLNSVLESIEPALEKENLLITHTLRRDGEALLLVTSVTHAVTMASISCEMELYFKRGDMQSLGSALTYARRYSLQLLLSLSAEDDDGVAAVGNTVSNTHGNSRAVSSVFASGNSRQVGGQVAASKPVPRPAASNTGHGPSSGGQLGRP